LLHRVEIDDRQLAADREQVSPSCRDSDVRDRLERQTARADVPGDEGVETSY
jgi:hypothetical protein